MRRKVLGVGFDNLTLAEAVDAGEELIGREGFRYVVTPNPEIVMMARKDPEYHAVLSAAALVLPDGIGVIKAAKILGRPLKSRVPGIDFASGLVARVAEKGQRLFLLGAKPGVAVLAAANLQKRYPNLRICGVHDGYFTDDDEVIAAVREAKADVLFVCLGAPKQEFWMAKHGAETGARLAVGLGGVLDVYAGLVERAPERWQRLGLEWLYRLKQEPKRLKRMIKLPWFLVLAVGARIMGR